jgi:hypothetical protein
LNRINFHIRAVHNINQSFQVPADHGHRPRLTLFAGQRPPPRDGIDSGEPTKKTTRGQVYLLFFIRLFFELRGGQGCIKSEPDQASAAVPDVFTSIVWSQPNPAGLALGKSKRLFHHTQDKLT